MIKNIAILVLFLLIGFIGCEKDEDVSYLDSLEANRYYSTEIVPENIQIIYDKWRLIGISGGYMGWDYPDFDFLEIKRIGIYGLIRNDTLFEYGKIEIDTFDYHGTNRTQIRFVPEYFMSHKYFSFTTEYFIDLFAIDTLTLNSGCVDCFNYHFKRNN